MSWSFLMRSLQWIGVGLVLASVGAISAAGPVGAADPSPGSLGSSVSPAVSTLPGPVPTCTPEVEPNDTPEAAPILSSAICLTGTLPQLRDQDLVLWDVEPAEALITWRMTVVGIPTTITSIHVFEIRSEPGVFPVDAHEFMRVDSDAASGTPGLASGVSLKAGRYLLGVSRGDPATGPAPAGEYRVAIEREQSLPANGDVEPNDDAAAATPVSDPISLIGDAQGSLDLYRWMIGPADAADRRQLDVRGVAGEALSVRLLDAAGAELSRTDMSRDGDAHLYDLQLAAGDYLIELSGSSAGPVPYVLTSQPSSDTTADAEPNDDPGHALALAIGETRTGRLAGPRDFDDYALNVPVTVAATQTDVALHVGTAVDRRLCVRQLGGSDVQCRQGTGDLDISNLLLPAGDYIVEVSGTEDLGDRYQLAISDIGLVSPEREVEPNDTALTASPFDPSVVMHGRSANGDPDFFRITVKGQPQVWRLDATGRGIRQLLWVEPDGDIRGTADVAPDGGSASLWDLYLVPGEHWISMLATGEDYRLTMTPLGPRAAGSELEPNNDTTNAEPLALGEVRTGRLPGAADADVFRFSLQAQEHIILRLEPPADGALKVRLTAGDSELMRLRDPVIGQTFVYDAQLPTGDYELSLSSDSGSVAAYRLQVDRADAWRSPADLEPNDTVDAARELPATLVVTGSGWGASGEDSDWYRMLAPPDPATPLVVTTEGAVSRVDVTDGTHSVTMDPDPTRTTWTSRQLPGSVPLYLDVTSGGDYRATVSGAGLVAAPAVAELPLTLSLVPTTADVSAYELFGQRVEATLTLTNAGSSPLDVALDGTTSDDRWTATMASDRITVPAGASRTVPVSIGVPADAWADVPTRVSLRVRTDDGRQQTASTDITPRRDATPVGAAQVWPVPQPLLGGLDAASLALGASVVPFGNPVYEEQLHDGYAVAGAGYTGSISGQPVTFTVDLATDEPVPVRGLIVDPLAGTPVLRASPRAFDLLLSDDGSNWEVALSGELTPRQEDQAFVLDQPVMARFAQLRIDSTWSGDRSSLQIGEWQVIAEPGWAPAAALDIADPANGGHIIFAEPPPSDPRQLDGMLTDEVESNPWQPYLDPGSRMSWVVGFLDGRAAQVTELQWVDPPDSDPTKRFEQLQVQVGTGSPLGPWTDVGTWTLDRAADGSVPPFHLPDGTWARYLRFEGDGPQETKGYWEVPATLRVMEHATDTSYRSIVGAWGRDQSPAIMEQLDPPDLSGMAVRDAVADGNDTPATATALVVDVPQDGRIQRGVDVDWYQLTIPADQNTLELSIAAPPAAGLEPTLQDSTGTVVPLTDSISTEPGVARYVADVVPGASYRLLLEQPPFSTVVTYDTSGSMGTYLSYVFGALRSFAADITPGEEAVQILPFEEAPLMDDFSDDAWQIEDAVTSIASARGSSAAETSLLAAMQQLQPRRGARAILVITDAATMSYYQIGALWDAFADVKPVVFSVHVGGGDDPRLTTGLMHDWASSWGGHYDYATSHGQIDRAFDRLATWLRRPATYTVGYGTSFISHAPGSLSVTPPAGPSGDRSVVAGTGVGVEILLDTSYSMVQKIGKQRRIDIAKSVLTDLVGKTLPSGLPVALRIFDPVRRCDSTLLAPLAPLDQARMSALIKGLKVTQGTRTPLAATLSRVAGDLGGSEGPKIIVLVTDGQESCKGNPAQAIRDLVAQGLDVHVNIVGFAIDDAKLRAQLQAWAALGNGQAFDAQGEADLAAGIATALRAPFNVYDQDDQLVASGLVGGDPVSLPPGQYRVEVLTDPVLVLKDVVIAAGTSKDIQLEPPPPTP